MNQRKKDIMKIRIIQAYAVCKAFLDAYRNEENLKSLEEFGDVVDEISAFVDAFDNSPLFQTLKDIRQIAYEKYQHDWMISHDIDERLSITDNLLLDTKPAAASLDGLTFVITGSVHIFKNRNALKEDIESRGGKASGSVSSKTSYLISNEPSTSSKSVKAAKLGVPVITEAEYVEMTKSITHD